MAWHWWRRATPSRQSPQTLPAPAPPAVSQPFHSTHYSYHLLLPPGWQVVPEGSAAPVRPPVDVFAYRAGAVRLSIWSTPSAQRVLPPVPPDQHALTVPLPDGQPAPFVAHALTPTARVCLEGRWLLDGRRWLLALDLPADQVGIAAELLRPVWASLAVEA